MGAARQLDHTTPLPSGKPHVVALLYSSCSASAKLMHIEGGLCWQGFQVLCSHAPTLPELCSLGLELCLMFWTVKSIATRSSLWLWLFIFWLSAYQILHVLLHKGQRKPTGHACQSTGSSTFLQYSLSLVLLDRSHGSLHATAMLGVGC
jgi:hypothetical protein